MQYASIQLRNENCKKGFSPNSATQESGITIGHYYLLQCTWWTWLEYGTLLVGNIVIGKAIAAAVNIEG